MFSKVLLLVIAIQTVVSVHGSAKRCARAIGSCVLDAEVTQGPYYWNSTIRQDITEGRPGIPLRLALTVIDTATCAPVPNAVVDLWHCDAGGLYSHYIASSLGQMGGPTDNSTFFRGQQITNSRGIAIFNTIYPGWYRGRATHIHLKVHIGASLTSIGGVIHVGGGHVSHTGQIYFDDSLTDAVAAISPYSAQTFQRTRNDEDFIYRQSGGVGLQVPIRFLSDEFTAGMTGEMTVGVNPSATPTPEEGPRPPRPPTTPAGR